MILSIEKLSMQSEKFWQKNKGQRLFEEAIKLETEGKTSEAIKVYRKSVKYWPKNGQAQYNLGIALATQGCIDQAIRAWKRAIWLNQAFQQELIQAFDLNVEQKETILFDNTSESFYAKAA